MFNCRTALRIDYQKRVRRQALHQICAFGLGCIVRTSQSHFHKWQAVESIQGLLQSSKQPADLVSLRFYDASGNKAEVENGVIVKLQGYEDGEREVMKAVAASAGDDLNDCAIVAAPEVMYDERKKNLDEFINEAGKAVRGYIPRSRNVFSVTKEGFVGGTAPTKGAEVGIGTGGKIDAAGKGLGVCVDVEVVGRYTYYAIKIGKTEAAASTTTTPGQGG